MTIEEYLRYATNLLASNSIDTSRLDSLVLMEYVMSTDRSKLLANQGDEVTPTQQNVLNKLLEKRIKHTPVSYITHNKEFYGRNFFINKFVLEPRPESETMIDMLIHIVRTDKDIAKLDRIEGADIGTGSGALGITSMLECKNLVVDLIDIDDNAIKVAKRNVVLHTIDTSVIKANLLPDNNKKYSILLCNLPYVPDDFKINLAASHEPKIAIFGGKDGLSIYRKLFELLKFRQHKPLYILTESLPTQHDKLESIASSIGYSLVKTDDFIQLYRLS